MATDFSPATESSARKRTRNSSPRIIEQPSFVLHRSPYRETSLVIDVFSRDYGRLTLVAKGAKRPHSALRGVLQTFQPLALGWSGKSEMRTLTRADWVGGMQPLVGDALLCGFYVNELLARFCAREDVYLQLFNHYTLTLTRLATGVPSSPTLRSFERMLLQEIGYAREFDRLTKTRELVVPSHTYVFEPEYGVREARTSDPAHWPIVLGQTLIDMEHDDYASAVTLTQSKNLMRFLLHHYLGGAPLHTRQILASVLKIAKG